MAYLSLLGPICSSGVKKLNSQIVEVYSARLASDPGKLGKKAKGSILTPEQIAQGISREIHRFSQVLVI